MKTLILSILVFMSFDLYAELKLRSLQDATVASVPPQASKPSIGVIFKKDCLPCRKQLKDLKCLKEEFDVFLIGGFSSEAGLRQEYLKIGQNYPAFYGDTESLLKLNVVSEATPQLLHFTDSGPKVHLGYRKCEEYKKVFSLERRSL